MQKLWLIMNKFQNIYWILIQIGCRKCCKSDQTAHFSYICWNVIQIQQHKLIYGFNSDGYVIKLHIFLLNIHKRHLLVYDSNYYIFIINTIIFEIVWVNLPNELLVHVYINVWKLTHLNSFQAILASQIHI